MQDSEFKKRYKNIPDCFRQIYRSVGIAGLYKGLTLNILRNSLMNAAELSTYDSCRQYAMRYGHDEAYLYLFYGIAAGFIAAIVSQPVDLLKTRVMNNPEIYPTGRQ